MDVDDDDEYTNAAAAHAAFVMTVSAARMYWLLRRAQHARDINIHKLHPFPEKNRFGLCRSSAHGTHPFTELKTVPCTRVALFTMHSPGVASEHPVGIHRHTR